MRQVIQAFLERFGHPKDDEPVHGYFLYTHRTYMHMQTHEHANTPHTPHIHEHANTWTCKHTHTHAFLHVHSYKNLHTHTDSHTVQPSNKSTRTWFQVVDYLEMLMAESDGAEMAEVTCEFLVSSTLSVCTLRAPALLPLTACAIHQEGASPNFAAKDELDKLPCVLQLYALCSMQAYSGVSAHFIVSKASLQNLCSGPPLVCVQHEVG